MDIKTDFGHGYTSVKKPYDPFSGNTNLSNKTFKRISCICLFFFTPIDNSDSFKFILGQISVLPVLYNNVTPKRFFFNQDMFETFHNFVLTLHHVCIKKCLGLKLPFEI